MGGNNSGKMSITDVTLFFWLNGSEYPPSTTPQACIIIPDLLLVHMVGEEGEGGTARTGERERAKRQGC